MHKLTVYTIYLILICIFISNISFAVIYYYRNLVQNNEILWELFLPEENESSQKRPFFNYIDGTKEGICCLEERHSTFKKNSTGKSVTDTAIKKPKGFISQAKLFFDFIQLSVNDWKFLIEGRREEFTRDLRGKIIGYFLLPLGGIAMGFVFGDVTLIPDTMNHSLKIIGMSHVVSASGYNISVLVSMVAPLFRRFWPRRELSYSLLMCVWLYIWLAGSSPSLVRAGVMSTLVFVGSHLLLQQINPLRVLVVTVVFLALFNRELVTSLSFQLSVSATLGLILFMPWLSGSPLAQALAGLPNLHNQENPAFTGVKKFGHLFFESFLTTLAAQAFTVPLLWKHFQEISLLSLVSNTALLWLTPVITLSSAIGVIAIVLLGSLPAISSTVVIATAMYWVIVELFTRGVTFFASFEGTVLLMPELSWGGVGIWWGILLFLSWQLSRQKYLSQNRKLDELYAF